MQIFNKIILGALFMVSGTLFAQQEGVITNYMYHMNFYNPAYVGVDGVTMVNSSFRQQWTGIKNAPSAEAVSFGTSLGNNLGMGVSIYNSNTFVESQTFTGVDFSYRLKFSETMDLYLGLKAGGNFYNLNTSGLETYNVMTDPSVNSISNFNPNVGVGALLKVNDWYASIAMPRLLSTDRADNEEGIVTAALAKPHVYATAGYDLMLNSGNNLMLQPSTMVRYVSGAPVSVDINTMLSFNGDFAIGATYRTDAAFAALMNFTIKKHLMIGYAYEVSTRTELASAKNTNEFLMRFIF
ncbi:MAG: PorP/SprF family type IX secretion system membrane protein [Maribacter arcticus]|uniref:Type IX secretion system membrane protein, PorP/SprF family n=1 Tax=Maribacter arcticus TaxID=561365 RepID=A0A1T5BBM3_9FLAO|nr:PorP/SprF family type IX secretion system membrane protein [Maribacter arcticus]SKB44618.1 type IX secretion system membrane protein, PorP/SprF family [Maribacter arcticus]